MSEVLARITEAERQLAVAEDALDTLNLEAIAKAAEVYAIEQGATEHAIRAAIFRLKARRKTTDIVSGQIKHGGNKQGNNAVTLADYSITKMDWQRRKHERQVSEEKFNEFCDEHIERQWVPTPTSLRRLANKINGKDQYEYNEPVHKTQVQFGFWPLPRPLTKHWGSGKTWQRICREIGTPDVAFGVTDGIPERVLSIDHSTGYEWRALPFKDNQFTFGYWDPPYDKLYKPEGIEIWRTCKKLAVLHTHVYPTSWFSGAARSGMFAVTMGPLKQIRCLQVFDKVAEWTPKQYDLGLLKENSLT